ncbi:hypothetical protein Tco_1088089, partial [Tanacetum coccineum]
MTRSSANELFTPCKEPEREFRSSRRHFKSLSLNELRSPDFNLLFDQEYLEEEEAEAMAKTMEQYMSKTLTDYGSGILDSRGVVPTKIVVDAKTAIQEMVEYSQKWHNGTSRGRNVAIRNQGASIKTLKIQIGQMSKVLQERGFGSLPCSTETNPRDQVKSISTTIEADSHSIRHIGSTQYAVSTGQNSTLLYKSRQMTVPFLSHLDNHYYEEEERNYRPEFTEAYGASHINNAIPQKEKD